MQVHDLFAAEMRYAGCIDLQTMLAMTVVFEQSTRSLLDNASQAVAASDEEAARAALHSLCGGALAIGADRLATQVRSELAEDPVDASSIAALEDVFAETCAAIRTWKQARF